jgi:hypothetical protein
MKFPMLPLAVAGFSLWLLSAQMEDSARFESAFWNAAFGWLLSSVVAAPAAGEMPDTSWVLPARGEAASHVAGS